MTQSAKQYLVIICTIWVMLWGCHSDTSKAESMPVDQSMALLTKLTSPHESERFRAQTSAIQRMEEITLRKIEDTLTALRQKNVSTLIYVCIKTQNDALYRMSPPAKMAIENADGAFPNIAYYYARVNPLSGFNELASLYRRYPEHRLPICLALGELKQPDARHFLLTQARKTKSAGESVVAHLHGLKGASNAIDPSQVLFMLDQRLGREEIIALAELDVSLSDSQLQMLWRSGAAKRSFALQSVLGDPEAYFDSLRWIIKQYFDAGQLDIVHQLMLSDSMRMASNERVKQYREAILKKIKMHKSGMN